MQDPQSKKIRFLKCLWCGCVLPITQKGRPKQHRNGTKTCVGSGQKAEVHENQRLVLNKH